MLSCPVCSFVMRFEHSHYKCYRCGYVAPCCEGDQVQPSCPPDRGERRSGPETRNR